MLVAFHKLRRDEEGQTLVLAAIALLVLSLCVMATINIGHATHERIRLQNTADATAYSLAASTARVFNFFAYTNRTMIVHYHSMFTFISYLSFMQYIQNTFGRICDALRYVPYIGWIAAVIGWIIDAIVQVLDMIVILVIPGMAVFNVLLLLGQFLMATSLATQTLGNIDVVEENDPDVRYNPEDTILGWLVRGANTAMAAKALDFKHMAQLFYKIGPGYHQVTAGDTGNEGRIIMTELINNARHGWVAGTKTGWYLVGRRWELGPIKIGGGILPASFEFHAGKIARTEQGMRTHSATKHDQLYAVDSLFFTMEFDVGWGIVASAELSAYYLSEVWADQWRGGHAEQIKVDVNIGGILGWLLDPVMDFIVDPLLIVAQTLMDIRNASGQHHFHIGITPYFKFRPVDRWRLGFNQPDFIVMTAKEDDDLREMFSRQYSVDWQVSGERVSNPRGQDSSVDFAIDTFDPENDFVAMLYPNGFNALAVSRVYYHRPGEWKEHPNFFNPFWAAKLHPIAHHQLVEFLHFGPVLRLGVTH